MADEKLNPVDDPVQQTTAIPWYDATTIRALLVAVVGLIGQFASLLGISETVFNEHAGKIVDSISTILILGGVVWAAYSRARQPTPPIKASKADADAHNALTSVTKEGDTVVMKKMIAPPATEEKSP